MRKILCGVGGYFLFAVFLSIFAVGSYGDPKEVCQARNQSYKIADSKQCDAYHECVKSGKLLPRLCDDGFQFSEEIKACDYPHNVNCSGRELLQESPSTNPDCPRMNGFYPFPPADSCQKFYHCLEGKAYEKTCPDGVIFDPSKGTCMHPDRSKRPECSAKKVLNFTCPNHGKKFVRLRFGDHDRLPHPTNCRKFVICLADGNPRVGGCPLGKVFHPKLGICDSPKQVPECRDYYGKKDLAKLAKLAELGEEGLVSDDDLDSIETSIDEDERQKQDASEEAPEEEAPAPPPKKTKTKKFQSKRATSADNVSGLSGQPNASVKDAASVVGPANKRPGSQSKSSEEEDDSDNSDEDN
jgi:hypothetical protein